MNKTRIGLIAAVALMAAGAVACGQGNRVASSTDPGSTADTQSSAPRTAPLTKSDIKLTVKTTKKDCFGSAGCNVEYKISAAIGKDVSSQECDVTYEVRGLEDTQTGTLNLHADGTYEQDDFQYGETASSSRKLTAVIADIDCGVLR